jgi:hypothetical protein
LTYIFKFILLCENLDWGLVNLIIRMLLIWVLHICILFWLITAILLIKRRFLSRLLLLALKINLVFHLRFSRFCAVHFFLICMIERYFLYLFLSSLLIEILLILKFLLVLIYICIIILELNIFLNFWWIILLFEGLTITYSHSIRFWTRNSFNWIGSINSRIFIHIDIIYWHRYVLGVCFSIFICPIYITLFLALIVFIFLHNLLIFS